MFDKRKADAAVEFFGRLKHTKGRWAGVPFDLLSWQEKIIRDLFGTVRKDGSRQYHTAYIEVPKKNGKSELAAGVALKLLAADGEWAAEVYGAAADRGQASIVFDVAVDMVDQWPALKKKCKLLIAQKRIVYEPTKSFYQVLSAEAFSKHGFNVHGVVFDELHAQPNRQLYDVLTEGAGDARMQPLTFVITTAGDDPDRTSICWEVHQKAERILDGTAKDPTFYAIIFGSDPEDDWRSEKVWKRANPSLGVTIPLERVREAADAAKDNPAKERNFRQLRLNQWVKTHSDKWVGLDKWDATAGLVVPEKLRGRQCFAGLDLSSKIDITASVYLFPPEDDDLWYLLADFWIPEENVKSREERDSVPYRDWIDQGIVRATPGNVIDYAFIEQSIIRRRDEFEVVELGYDPWNAMQTAIRLEDAGLTVAEVRQGFKTMSPAMKELETLVVGKRLRHGGNPVLRWMFGNIQVKQDENENIRPIKKRASGRIDGIVATLNALDRAMRHEDEDSVYAERGILTL